MDPMYCQWKYVPSSRRKRLALGGLPRTARNAPELVWTIAPGANMSFAPYLNKVNLNVDVHDWEYTLTRFGNLNTASYLVV